MATQKRTFSWMNPKLEVRETEKYGKGVFAKASVRKEDILTIFGGYIMTADEMEKLPEKIKDESLQISENFIIGVKRESEMEVASYFNHSCDPNAGFYGQITLVAMRSIKKGEQVVFDYAMILHKSKNVKLYKMKCLCGAKRCRKVITDNDWKIQKIQRQYKSYFQYYLQDKIKNLKTT